MQEIEGQPPPGYIEAWARWRAGLRISLTGPFFSQNLGAGARARNFRKVCRSRSFGLDEHQQLNSNSCDCLISSGESIGLLAGDRMKRGGLRKGGMKGKGKAMPIKARGRGKLRHQQAALVNADDVKTKRVGTLLTEENVRQDFSHDNGPESEALRKSSQLKREHREGEHRPAGTTSCLTGTLKESTSMTCTRTVTLTQTPSVLQPALGVALEGEIGVPTVERGVEFWERGVLTTGPRCYAVRIGEKNFITHYGWDDEMHGARKLTSGVKCVHKRATGESRREVCIDLLRVWTEKDVQRKNAPATGPVE